MPKDRKAARGNERLIKILVITALYMMAEPTGLEPATSDVTGRRSNQLNYDSAFSNYQIRDFKSVFLPDSGGRHGGARTHNLHLVRVAVYH